MNTTKRKNVIVKGVLALIMAAIVLFASACGSFWGASETPLAPNNNVTDPSGNNGSTAPDNPDSQYSKILQDVLKSEYYNGIISKYKDGVRAEIIEHITQHPFKLFEDIGIDVSALKARQLNGSSFAYIKGNDTHNLYVNSRVEGNSGTPYYHCVTACYELSEQEYNDLSMLYEGGYIQAPFFVQELSYAKEPKFFTHSKISVAAYKDILTTCKNSIYFTTNVFGTNDVEVFLNSFSLSEQLFEVSVVHTEKYVIQ